MSLSKIEIEEKRRDERCVYCTQNEAKFGCITGHLVSGSFKRRRRRNAHIKNLGTPLISNFKIFGGHSPKARIISAPVGCSIKRAAQGDLEAALKHPRLRGDQETVHIYTDGGTITGDKPKTAWGLEIQDKQQKVVQWKGEGMHADQRKIAGTAVQ